MGMNLFRVVGDVSHYAAILTIFIKIVSSKSCKGISGKTQILYLLVFLSRYIDLFFHFISWYNTSVKIFFILSSITNIYLVIPSFPKNQSVLHLLFTGQHQIQGNHQQRDRQLQDRVSHWTCHNPVSRH